MAIYQLEQKSKHISTLQSRIDELETDFYCGGDSMGDTELRIYDKKEQSLHDDINFEREGGSSWGEYKERILTLIEDKIYADVEFYVNSDGHYQGESGVVEMTFDEEESIFNCSKSSSPNSIPHSGTKCPALFIT